MVAGQNRVLYERCAVLRIVKVEKKARASTLRMSTTTGPGPIPVPILESISTAVLAIRHL